MRAFVSPPDARRWLLLLASLAVLLEAAAPWLRGYRFGRNVVVRCRAGHLFTTTWLPGGSLKAIRLGWWRLQRCPVGRHWTLVKLVKESDLSADQRRHAAQHRDIRIP